MWRSLAVAVVVSAAAVPVAFVLVTITVSILEKTSGRRTPLRAALRRSRLEGPAELSREGHSANSSFMS
jgi:hypothetical protein